MRRFLNDDLQGVVVFDAPVKDGGRSCCKAVFCAKALEDGRSLFILGKS